MKLDRFMQFKIQFSWKSSVGIERKMKGDNGDVYMALLILWLWWPLNLWFVEVVILQKAWHHIRQKHMACGQIETMTARAIFLPVSWFLYRLGEPKTDRKVVNLHEDKRRELIRFKEAFIEGYGAFQDKARECGIEKIDFSIGVKHKKPDPPDFPSGRLFTVSPEDEWQIYRGFMLGENAKD